MREAVSKNAYLYDTMFRRLSIVSIIGRIILCHTFLIHPIHAFIHPHVLRFHQPSRLVSDCIIRMNNDDNNQGFGVTSTVISQLAVAALKLRLAESSSVVCDVTASSSKLLLQGRVGPITVKGKRWASPLGLTCRAIEASVSICYLDVSAIVARRKLVLIEPAKGDAMVAFNAHDFGNFITHPLLKPPPVSEGNSIIFQKDGVQIVSPSLDGLTLGGYIIFYIFCLGKRWQCRLQRGGLINQSQSRVHVVVEPAVATTQEIHPETEIAYILTNFFNTLVFNLDGTYLTIKDLMINVKGTVPTILLSLHITVKKFPSYRLQV